MKLYKEKWKGAPTPECPCINKRGRATILKDGRKKTKKTASAWALDEYHVIQPQSKRPVQSSQHGLEIRRVRVPTYEMITDVDLMLMCFVLP